MVNNPTFYGALIIRWLVAFPGFILTCCGYVMSIVVPAAACLLILGSFGAIIIAQ